ncbi:MAG: hypothetical protein QG608_1608 [Actinomycetota bacterium]|nr:hypothetical protein [Actinomycetota bacterium]
MNTHVDLTARERDVLVLVVDGCTTREIARQLSISSHTVDTHLRRMRRKLGARCRADLVRIALLTSI